MWDAQKYFYVTQLIAKKKDVGCPEIFLCHTINRKNNQNCDGHYINPLRTVAAYMRHGNNNITVCKQIAVTPPLFTL